MGFYAALKPYSLLEPYVDPSITYPELFKSPCPAPDMRHFLLSVPSSPFLSLAPQLRAHWIHLQISARPYSCPIHSAYPCQIVSLKTNALIMTLPTSKPMVSTADWKIPQA